MIMYAKIVNQVTGLCLVGNGDNTAQYRAMAMTPMDVQQSDIDGQWYLKSKCPMKTDEQKELEERERLNGLMMTRGDVFEALILAKGLSKLQIRALIEQAEIGDTEKLLYLNRFDEALNFYRGYPIFDLLGEVVGITSEMWDSFFESKDYRYLTTCELTINVTPEDSTVFINEVEGAGSTAPYGSTVNYFVSCEGYEGRGNIFEITEDTTLDIELEKSPVTEETSEEAENG